MRTEYRVKAEILKGLTLEEHDLLYEPYLVAKEPVSNCRNVKLPHSPVGEMQRMDSVQVFL